jgi:uncharacterized protein (DUF1684 family)
VYIEFTDSALGALVMSRTAFEAMYGHSYDAMLMCLQVIDGVHRISDLLSLACLQVLTIALTDGGIAIALTHRPSGLGLQFHPLDRDYRVVQHWTDLGDLDGDTVNVTTVLGVMRSPVTAASQ